MSVSSRRWAGRVAALGAAAALALGSAGTASAAELDFLHDVAGTSHIASTDSTIAVGPTTLSTTLDNATGNFTGHMPLPGTRTRFEVLGFIPVEADVAFVEASPVVGDIDIRNNLTPVRGTASYYIKLSNIKIVGFPTFTGPFCRTKEPVQIPVNTPEGQSFNLIQGGVLEGEFSIGNFQNCGLNTWLINLLVPGSGNTLSVNVTNGRFVPAS